MSEAGSSLEEGKIPSLPSGMYLPDLPFQQQQLFWNGWKKDLSNAVNTAKDVANQYNKHVNVINGVI